MPTIEDERTNLGREDNIDSHYGNQFGYVKDAEQAAGKQAGYGRDSDGNNSNTGNENIKKTNDKERAANQNPYNWDESKNRSQKPVNRRQKFIMTLKKASASIAITGGIFGGFMALSLVPSTLAPVAFIKVITNDLNDTANVSRETNQALWKNKLGGKAKIKALCAKPTSIRCKHATMSDIQAENFKNAKVGLAGEETVGGRKVISGLTFDDGRGGKITASTPEQLDAVLKNNVSARSQMYRAHNPDTGTFFGKRFITSVLGKIGIDKSKKIKGNTESEADESYKRSVQAASGDANARVITSETGEPQDEGDANNPNNDAIRNNEAASAMSEDLNNLIGGDNFVTADSVKAGANALAVPQAACSVIQVATIVNSGKKVATAAMLAKFAMIFLVLGSTILGNDGSEDNGAATAAEVEKATDILIPSEYPQQVQNPETGKMEDNPNIGKTAFDSEGFKLAAHGDVVALNAFAAQYMLGGSSGLLQKIMDAVYKVASPSTVRKACGIINNKFVVIAATVAGGVVGLIGAGLAKVFEEQINDFMAAAINKAIGYMTNANLTTDIIGVDAGNAVFAGTAYIMSRLGASFGMVPGSADSIMKNMVANNEARQDFIAVAKYNARSTPFDINNEYSFLGSLVHNLYGVNPSGFAKISTLVGKAINPLAASVSVAHADGFIMNVSNYKKERFQQCSDNEYKAAGYDADVYCNLRFVPMPFREVEETDAYMINSKAIDEDGNILDTSAGKQYQDWIDGCSEQRTAPFGTAQEGVGKYDTGDCDRFNDEATVYYSNHYNQTGVHSDQDEEPLDKNPQANTQANQTPEGSTPLDLPSKEGWVWPVPGIGVKDGLLPYGESGSKGIHKGTDIGLSNGGALGKTVVAAHDGVVTYSGGTGQACGEYIVIKANGTPYYAGYQHIINRKVQKGDTVVAGQPIAVVGKQGITTCGFSRFSFYHIHFSIETISTDDHPISEYADPFPHGTIDPLSILPTPPQ